MKQSIYQKLLLSLMLFAFFGTLASAQVMSRSDVDARQIQSQKQMMSELKVKAKAQGLTATPQEWIDEARQQRNEAAKQVRSECVATQRAKAKVVKKAVLKPNVERKSIAKTKTSLHQKARELNEKYAEIGYKAVISNVGGKEYIELKELPQQYGVIPTKAKN